MQILKEAIMNFPAPVISSQEMFNSSEEGFTIEAEGTGSLTGVTYSIPAHSTGEILYDINMLAITTQNVKDLNDAIMNMLDASQQKYVRDYSSTHASADISIWSIFGGGGSASYEKTYEKMSSMGLTQEQITIIINKFFECANKFSNVGLKITVDNRNNNYSVSGDLQLYTISGTIKTSKGTAQYRLLANNGTAGNGAAPTSGEVIPLN